MSAVAYEAVREAFLLEYAHTMFAWQPVEQNHFFIFQDLLKHEQEPDLIAAVFHSVNGLAIRVDMTSAAAIIRLGKDTAPTLECQALMNRIKKQSENRNVLAHFTFHIADMNGPNPHPVLRPTMFHPLANHRQEYDISQLRVWRSGFGKLAADLDGFVHKLQKLI